MPPHIGTVQVSNSLCRVLAQLPAVYLKPMKEHEILHQSREHLTNYALLWWLWWASCRLCSGLRDDIETSSTLRRWSSARRTVWTRVLRAFSVLGPRLCNSLPRLLHDTGHDTTSFRHFLKTFFSQSTAYSALRALATMRCTFYLLTSVCVCWQAGVGLLSRKFLTDLQQAKQEIEQARDTMTAEIRGT